MRNCEDTVVLVLWLCVFVGSAPSIASCQPPERLVVQQRLIGLKGPPSSLSFVSRQEGIAECIATDDSSTAFVFDCRSGAISQRISLRIPAKTKGDEDEFERLSCVGVDANAQLFVGGFTGRVALFRQNGQELFQLVSTWKPTAEPAVKVCALGKRSHWLVLSDDRSVQLFDSSKGQAVRTWNADEVIQDICTDGTGRMFALAQRESNRVRIYHGIEWNETQVLDVAIAADPLSPKGSQVRQICLSRDGKSLFCWYNDQRLAKISRETGKFAVVFDNRRPPDGMERWIPAFELTTSPNDKYLATGSYSGYGLIFDTKELRPVALCRQEAGMLNGVSYVAWSPDGKYLATSDDVTEIVNVWKTSQFAE